MSIYTTVIYMVYAYAQYLRQINVHIYSHIYGVCVCSVLKADKCPYIQQSYMVLANTLDVIGSQQEHTCHIYHDMIYHDITYITYKIYHDIMI